MRTDSPETPAPASASALPAAVSSSTDASSSPLSGKTVVVVGAGGAGRALAFGAAVKGAKVVIANRSLPKAAELAAQVRHARCALCRGRATVHAGPGRAGPAASLPPFLHTAAFSEAAQQRCRSRPSKAHCPASFPLLLPPAACCSWTRLPPPAAWRIWPAAL